LKNEYLPECHTDFIIAITGEELGLVAILGIIACYLVLIAATLIIGARSRDFRGQLLCVGLGAGICCHALLNLAFVSGSMPTTGVTAPLISYGGSSLISTFIAIGLLLSVERQGALACKEEEEPARDNNTMTRSIPVEKELIATSTGRIPVQPKEKVE
jgi:cell division protein FtsW